LLSLEGLENLERAGHLSLNGFSVASLESLSNLSALTANGGIQLVGCGELRDLSGLDNVVGLQSLEVNCDNLESLSGLPFPDSMNTVLLSGMALKDLGQFDMINLQALLISGSGLENLAGAQSLQTVGALSIAGNPELVDAGALDSLLSVDFLDFTDNAALERLPELPSLSRIESLVVADNPLLQNVPSLPRVLDDFVGLSEFGLSRRDLLTFELDLLEIRNNPALEQLVVPAGLQAAGLVTIENNAALESISFSDVAAADFVSVKNNPALSNVALGDLTRVDELEVSGNPALDLTVFDTLSTFSSDVSLAPAGEP
jgi:Leucine-rich repeat (LRR) protein